MAAGTACHLRQPRRREPTYTSDMTTVFTYETSISHVTDGHTKDEYVIIETSEKSVITALERKPDQFEKIFEDNSPGFPRLVRFRIPFENVNWAALAKRQGPTNPNSLNNLRNRVPGV